MQDNVKRLIKTCNDLYENKFVSGKSGNVSIRLDDYIAITPTLMSLGDLKEEDIVLVDMKGNCLTSGEPSSEVGMHLAIYEKRDDVNAIVHIHSPYVTGFAFSDKKIKRLEGFGQINQQYLSSIEYERPGSEELALKASEGIKDEDVLILKNHGMICVGNNLKEAQSLAMFIEESAKTQFVSIMLNSVKDI